MGNLRELLDKGKQKATTPVATPIAPTPPPPEPAKAKPRFSFGKKLEAKPQVNGAAAPIPTPPPKPPAAPKPPEPQAIQRTQVVQTRPAEAPVRNDIGAISLDQIKQNIRYLSENIDQKELVGQVVRTICVQLKNNPQFKDGVADEEYDVITRGLMFAYNVAARKKVEGTKKRTDKVEKQKLVFSDLDNALGEFFK